MIVKNAWYVAAHTDELKPGGVLGRTIAGEAMVLCRDDQGQIFVLGDTCPHRLAPLSLGEMVGAHLRCGYHGAMFDSTGACVKAPGEKSGAAEAGARRFPAQDKHGCIWVWTGDPAKSHDETSIPEFMAKYGGPPNELRNGMLPVKADHTLLIDNLLDPTHAEFVHRNSFGAADWAFVDAAWDGDEAKRPSAHFNSNVREKSIDFVFDLRNTPGGPYARAYGMRRGQNDFDGLIDLRMEVDWAPPGIFSYAQIVKGAGANEEPLRMVNLHIVTPETERTTLYFYRCSFHGTGGNSGIADFWFKVAEKAFAEDKYIIEAQQTRIGTRELMDCPIQSFDSDYLSLRGREILATMS